MSQDSHAVHGIRSSTTKNLFRLALAHSSGVAAAADRPRSTMKRRMRLIRWTASPNPSMLGCTSVSNGQLTRWRSARPGLREMGPLMAAQFQWGMPTSALILYLIRSITRCTLILSVVAQLTWWVTTASILRIFGVLISN